MSSVATCSRSSTAEARTKASATEVGSADIDDVQADVAAEAAVLVPGADMQLVSFEDRGVEHSDPGGLR